MLSDFDGPPECPECAVGKHGNCDGRSWDDIEDDYTACPCAEAGHQVEVD